MRLIVTNFNAHFTGVSATIAGLVPLQARDFDLYLCGQPLDGCPEPVSLRRAISLSSYIGPVIWHVRRNNEMLAALFVRDVLRRPIRIVFTSAAIRRHSAFPRWLISRMDAVVATSDAAAKLVPGVVATVPHGVNLARFTPAAGRASAWRDAGFGGEGGFVTVGRIRPEKGTDIFVETMLRLLPQWPGKRAVLLGRTTPEHEAFRRDLHERIAAAGLSDRFVFAGEVEPARVAKAMAGADLLFALPRYEGFGLTVLEAMACATPVIASDTGYFKSFAGESAAAIIVPAGDAGAAVQAAGELLSDPAAHAKASAEALMRAAVHSVEAEAEALARVYAMVARTSQVKIPAN